MKYSIAFHSPLKYASFLMASNQATSSRWIIHRVFDFDAAAPHVITPADIHLGPPIMLLLANVVAAPAPESYAAAQPSAGSSVPENAFDYFIPSVAIIIVVLVLGVLFMGLFSVCVCWYAQIAAEGGNLRLPRLSDRGLDPRAIESFPIFHYSEVKDHKIGRGALECAVCISEFEDDETLRLLPKCDHAFHPECIDAWLAFHTTCPICRANLKSTTPDEQPGHAGQVTESDDSGTEEQNIGPDIGPEIDGVQNENDNQNQIAIDVDEDENRDPQPQAGDTPNRNQRRVAKFPRSHSTGHSLVLPGESCERYTLRLSQAARQQIISQRLKRTRSLWGISLPTTEESSRRGYRSGGEGSSRGRQVGRWVRAMTPPFLSRTGSIMSPKGGVNGDVTSVGTVLTPFSCLAGKSDGVGNSSNHPPL